LTIEISALSFVQILFRFAELNATGPTQIFQQPSHGYPSCMSDLTEVDESMNDSGISAPERTRRMSQYPESRMGAPIPSGNSCISLQSVLPYRGIRVTLHAAVSMLCGILISVTAIALEECDRRRCASIEYTGTMPPAEPLGCQWECMS